MLGPLKSELRRTPLYGRYRSLRQGLHRAGLGATERLVSAATPYEILVVFGMRRSGNHLAISWILAQVRGSAAFYNNINPAGPPFAARMTEFRLRGRNPSPRIVLSYEDVDRDTLLSRPLTSFLEERTVRHGVRVRFALILRDPLNLFASRLKKWPERFATEADLARERRLYLDHARLAAGTGPIWHDAPLVPVLYNEIVADPAARDRAADALGLARGHAGLDAVPVYGHGSSFDGTAGSAEAIRASVFSRWQAQADDPAFRKLIDPEMREIAQARFGLDAGPGVSPGGAAATTSS
jgi:hypothetical protein